MRNVTSTAMFMYECEAMYFEHSFVFHAKKTGRQKNTPCICVSD